VALLVGGVRESPYTPAPIEGAVGGAGFEAAQDGVVDHMGPIRTQSKNRRVPKPGWSHWTGAPSGRRRAATCSVYGADLPARFT
jgi:hypothetical protein